MKVCFKTAHNVRYTNDSNLSQRHFCPSTTCSTKIAFAQIVSCLSLHRSTAPNAPFQLLACSSLMTICRCGFTALRGNGQLPDPQPMQRCCNTLGIYSTAVLNSKHDDLKLAISAWSKLCKFTLLLLQHAMSQL